MELLNTIAGFISKLFQWWFTVMPWEQALRIRKGKQTKLLTKGLYLRIPFIDSVYIQTTRMRMIDAPMQTISTKDGQAITVGTYVGYSIGNIEKLYTTLYHPEITLVGMSAGFVAEYVRERSAIEVKPRELQNYVSTKINGEDYGLRNLHFKITTFAVVKTFRLIQDNSWMSEGLKMDELAQTKK